MDTALERVSAATRSADEHEETVSRLALDVRELRAQVDMRAVEEEITLQQRQDTLHARGGEEADAGSSATGGTGGGGDSEAVAELGETVSGLERRLNAVTSRLDVAERGIDFVRSAVGVAGGSADGGGTEQSDGRGVASEVISLAEAAAEAAEAANARVDGLEEVVGAEREAREILAHKVNAVWLRVGSGGAAFDRSAPNPSGYYALPEADRRPTAHTHQPETASLAVLPPSVSERLEAVEQGVRALRSRGDESALSGGGEWRATRPQSLFMHGPLDGGAGAHRSLHISRQYLAEKFIGSSST